MMPHRRAGNSRPYVEQYDKYNSRPREFPYSHVTDDQVASIGNRWPTWGVAGSRIVESLREDATTRRAPRQRREKSHHRKVPS